MAERSPTRIEVPFPDAEPLQLTFAVGGCRIELAPGAGAAWVEGTYHDPSGALPAAVKTSGGEARVGQGVDVRAAPGLLSTGLPRFALALGKARPFSLAIQGGANEAALDLGGVPLLGLSIRQGAGRLRCDFSAPNPAAMARLDVEAGAVALELANLANAGFAELRLQGGAASYDLDFGGALARDASVRLELAMSSVRIAVPGTTAARVVVESTLGALDVGDGFTKREGAFCTDAAVRGLTPSLSIRASVTLGALRLVAT
jgi:hypothetical protein